MEKSNLDFLNDDLKYLGFGERSLLNHQLEEQIGRDQASFELYTEAFFSSDTKLEATLHFIRSTKSKGEYFFFNRYDTLLRYADAPDKVKAQTFYVNKGKGITFKESFNLLQGRAVFKTLTSKSGIQYTAWLQLNFAEKDIRENYIYTYFRGGRYELEKALEKHKIREMDYENLRTNLIRSLQRGNLHGVTIDGPEYTGKYLIEANPAQGTINLYPMAMRAAEKMEEESYPAAGSEV